MNERTKANRKDRNEKMVAGIKKHFANGPAILVKGVQLAPSDIEKVLTAPIDKAAATTAAEGAFHKAVADERSATAAANALFRALRAIVLRAFDGDAQTLADFGLAPPTRHEPTAAEKAAAVAARKATRLARGTRGPRQKKGIKGDSPPPAPPTKIA
jgi:hypothetical protein